MKLSIIVPVLNEALRIPECLRALSRYPEVIVADGGSTDGTIALVRKDGRARLIECERGRAVQMNAGARAAEGDVLLFLHADCALPEDALPRIEEALRDPRNVAGAFRTWHVADDGRRAFWLHLADLRSRYSGLPYGDQALFVRREVFEELGGFPALPLMEDLEFSQRLRRKGRIAIVRSSVRVSGRRFLQHPLRDTFLVNVFPLLYRLGVPAARLQQFYEDIR